MSRRTLLVVLALMVAPAAAAADYALAIHGGAGTIARESMTPEREREYHRSLREALATGEAILKAGGTSLDAVTATIQVLEDNPLFNAGRGAVFTAEGRNELDAAIMDGATLEAGAVAGVTRIRNPVLLARTLELRPARISVEPHRLDQSQAQHLRQPRGKAALDPRNILPPRPVLQEIG